MTHTPPTEQASSRRCRSTPSFPTASRAVEGDLALQGVRRDRLEDDRAPKIGNGYGAEVPATKSAAPPAISATTSRRPTPSGDVVCHQRHAQRAEQGRHQERDLGRSPRTCPENRRPRNAVTRADCPPGFPGCAEGKEKSGSKAGATLARRRRVREGLAARAGSARAARRRERRAVRRASRANELGLRRRRRRATPRRSARAGGGAGQEDLAELATSSPTWRSSARRTTSAAARTIVPSEQYQLPRRTDGRRLPRHPRGRHARSEARQRHQGRLHTRDARACWSVSTIWSRATSRVAYAWLRDRRRAGKTDPAFTSRRASPTGSAKSVSSKTKLRPYVAPHWGLRRDRRQVHGRHSESPSRHRPWVRTPGRTAEPERFTVWHKSRRGFRRRRRWGYDSRRPQAGGHGRAESKRCSPIRASQSRRPLDTRSGSDAVRRRREDSRMNPASDRGLSHLDLAQPPGGYGPPGGGPPGGWGPPPGGAPPGGWGPPGGGPPPGGAPPGGWGPPGGGPPGGPPGGAPPGGWGPPGGAPPGAAGDLQAALRQALPRERLRRSSGRLRRPAGRLRGTARTARLSRWRRLIQARPAPAFAAGPVDASQPFSPGDAITFAWERIKADPGTILGAVIVGMILSLRCRRRVAVNFAVNYGVERRRQRDQRAVGAAITRVRRDRGAVFLPASGSSRASLLRRVVSS